MPEQQEGDFKIKSKPKMKNLNKDSEITKVDMSKSVEAELDEPTKIVIPNEAAAAEDVTNIEEVIEEEVIIEEVIEEEEPTMVNDVKPEEVIKMEPVVTAESAVLPENIEKLVSFMKETGGNIEDYVRLNADYSTVDDTSLLKEYYKKTKPHLNREEINFLMEDKFSYDEDVDEEREVRFKKLAIKEEVANAKSFLEQTKSKYYDEIKLRPSVTQEQQKATEFFNRYNQDQEVAQAQHSDFKSKTNDYFTNDFKGFDFDVSGKKFRYGVQDPGKVAENQSNINNIVGKFLDDKGNVTDAKGYHKAMYMASNADTIINHFYEQGKSDATKEIISKSKNPSSETRQSAKTDGFVNGIKVKVLGRDGSDSSKLKIKKIKI
jgi:hypothetical protein